MNHPLISSPRLPRLLRTPPCRPPRLLRHAAPSRIMYIIFCLHEFRANLDSGATAATLPRAQVETILQHCIRNCIVYLILYVYTHAHT